MTCYEAIDVMGEALEDTLEPALRLGFDEHMAECGPCAAYFEHLHVVRSALLEMPREGATSPHRAELIEEFRRQFRRDGR